MRKILRPFYLLYQIFAYPLAGIASALTGISISLFGKYLKVKNGDYWPAVIWSKFMVRIFLLPITIKGREKLDPNKNYIFIYGTEIERKKIRKRCRTAHTEYVNVSCFVYCLNCTVEVFF